MSSRLGRRALQPAVPAAGTAIGHRARAAVRRWSTAAPCVVRGGRGDGRRWRGDRGSATAELAACLPAFMLLVFLALSAVTAARLAVECLDAARDAAQAAARGEDPAAAGARAAPTGAGVTVSRADTVVTATVAVRFQPLGGRLPGFTIRASSVAAIEPGAP